MDVPSIDVAHAAQIMKIEELQNAVEEIHSEVAGFVSKSRERVIDAQNKSTNILAVNFEEGNFVLVQSIKKKSHMLRFEGVGPKLLTAALSDLVFEVKNSVTEKREKFMLDA